MRKYAVRPALTLRGRTFNGLRGWSGKPSHPPLTDFPIAAYVLAAVFDVISLIGGSRHGWAREFFHAGTYVFIGGAVVSLLTATTGMLDWLKLTQPGTQARRTANTHATIIVTVLVLGDIAWRLLDHHTAQHTPAGIMILSVAIALLVSLGATFGGSLVFDYGLNVEAAADHPTWHPSGHDLLPGEAAMPEEHAVPGDPAPDSTRLTAP